MIRRPKRRRDPNQPYLAILVAGRASFQMPHAGLARNGTGVPFCRETVTLPVFALTAQDPRFSLLQNDGWRHRYAEAFLELNRGCPRCLDVLAQIGREVGYGTPKGLAA